VFLTSVDCQRWNNGSKQPIGRKNWRGSIYPEEGNGKQSQPEANASASKSSAVRRGGIGAWGYVAITLFLILSGLGIYYTIIFYPIVCKKQRMYHVMGSTT
ncbi:hypothetical protein RUM43_012336, partial [Polyplax serrata]